MSSSESLPIRDNNIVLEAASERYFKNQLPIEWLVDKPSDYGIDLIVTPTINSKVNGFNFAVQLKAQNQCGEIPKVSLKKTTLNYLFNRLEPAMVILYDDKEKKAYWKWLLLNDFDLSKKTETYTVKFNKAQVLSEIDWNNLSEYVQKIFKVKNRLLTALEYDLFNTSSEIESKAWAHYFEKNFSEAIFYFKRAESLESNSVLLLALSQCLYATYDYRSAMIYINKALDLDVSDNILHTKAGILAEDGIRENDRRKLHEAYKIFNELFDKNASDDNAFNLANTLGALGRNEDAEKLYKHALQLNPNYAEAWKNLAQIYFEQKKHGLEMKCYEKALNINPDLLEAKMSKAITNGAIYKKYELAIKVILECTDGNDFLFAQHPHTYHWIGLFYYELKKLKEALFWINKGLSNNPGDFRLLNRKAMILFRSLQNGEDVVDEAISFFASNFEINKDDSVNFYLLCYSIQKKGELEKASEMARSWLIDRTNIIGFYKEAFNQIDQENILLIIKHWGIIQSYVVQYSINKIEIELGFAGVVGYDDALVQLEAKRVLFIGKYLDYFDTVRKKPNFKKAVTDIYKSTFLRMNPKSICAMVKTPKVNLETFAKEMSLSVAVWTDVVAKEIARCSGWVIGNRFSATEREKQIDNLPENYYTDTLISLTEMFYKYFDLP